MLICLFFKFSGHSSVVLKLHTFSYLLVFPRQLFYMKNICTSTLTWPVWREGSTSCLSPFTELQCLLRIWYVSPDCQKEGGGKNLQTNNNKQRKKITVKKPPKHKRMNYRKKIRLLLSFSFLL